MAAPPITCTARRCTLSGALYCKPARLPARIFRLRRPCKEGTVSESFDDRQGDFDLEDLERLLGSIFEGVEGNPFEKIKEQLLELSSDLVDQEKITEEYRTEVFDQLEHIRARTFGILILQILKTIKLFMSLLPGGRVILIVLAGLALLESLFNDGTVSAGAIRDAVAKTGLADFIDDTLAQLRTKVGLIADHTGELADAASIIMVRAAGAFENVEAEVGSTVGTLEALIASPPYFIEDWYEQGNSTRISISILEGLRDDLMGALTSVQQYGNGVANGADVIGPALRNLDDRLREIPDLALKLVTFGD